jgi:hypothetical protein
MPSYDVCPCCGYEFGNDDNPGTGLPIDFHTYRQHWLRDGAKWFDDRQRPKDWNLNNQLRNVEEDAEAQP